MINIYTPFISLSSFQLLNVFIIQGQKYNPTPKMAINSFHLQS
jgi:hypothetical protein